MSEAGHVIGRVSVKVTPDLTGFHRTVKDKLRKIERQLPELKIKLGLDDKDTVEQAKRVQERVEKAIKSVKINVDLDDQASLERAIKRIDAELKKLREVKINVDLDEASLEKTRAELQERLTAKLKVDNEEAQKALDKITKKVQNIPLNPKLDSRGEATVRREMERLMLDLSDKEASIKPDMNPIEKRKVEHQIEEIKNKLDDLKNTKVKVDIETKEAALRATQARLALLGRDRVVKFIPTISNAAAARTAAGLGALSGGRVLKNMISDWGRWLGELDQAVPLIGSIVVAVAGLGSVGVTAASNLFALSASLAQIGPLALALPGMLGGIAIGLGTAFVALKDFNKVLPGVKRKFQDLQNSMSEKFWAKAKQPISDFIDTLFPEFQKGIEGTSTKLGGFFAKLATATKGEFNGALSGMFRDLNKSIDIATTGTVDLAKSMRILGEVGAGYLPRLAKWFNDVAKNFSAWLSNAQKTGKLNDWIETALTQFQALGRVIVNVGGILAGLGKAASKAGGSGLEQVADTTERISKAVNSPAAQSGLITILSSAHQFISDIANQSGPALQRFLGTLPGLIKTSLGDLGPAIGNILDGLFTGLSNPKFQKGFTDFVHGLSVALTSLKPAFVPLSTALGDLGTILGHFLEKLGPNVGTTIGALATAFHNASPAIDSLASLLGDALSKAIDWAAPKIIRLGTILGGLKDVIDNLNTSLSELSGGQIVAGIAAIAGAFAAFKAVGAVVSIVSSLATAIEGLSAAAALFGEGGALAGVGAVVVPILLVVAAVAALGLAFYAIYQKSQIVRDAFDGVVDAAKGLWEKVQPIAQQIAQVFVDAWPQIKETAQQAWSTVQTIVSTALLAIQRIIQVITIAITVVWSVFGDQILNIVRTAFNILLAVIRGALQVIQGIFTVFQGLLKNDWKTVWEGIKQIFKGVWTAISGIFKSSIAFIIMSFLNMVGIIIGAAAKAFGWVPGIGPKLKGAAQKFTEFKNKVNAELNGIKDKHVKVYADTSTASANIKALVAQINGMPKSRTIMVQTKMSDILDHTPGRAVGGPVDAGKTYLVGELGPELVTFSKSGYVHTAAETKEMLSQSDGTTSLLDASNGGTVHIDVHVTSNADPEDIAEELLFAVRHANDGGLYAKRGGS